MNLNNLICISPEIFLLALTCLVLLLDLYLPKKSDETTYVTYLLSQIALFGTLFLVWRISSQPTQVILNGGFVWDRIAALLKIFILVTSIFSFLYARHYIIERKINTTDYYILSLFSVLGMCLLVSAHNFLVVFLGLELTSLPLYALVALQRNSAIATEAAMKYFVLGAIASAMLLYGFSIFYGVIHTLDISTAAIYLTTAPANERLILMFGLVFVLVGIIFKLGAVPFHLWIPDVYQGSLTSMTLFIGSAPKIAALGMALRLLVQGAPSLLIDWHQILEIVAIASITLGNVVAIIQSNLKRMLSYSAIAHMGYMLLGLIAGTTTGYAAATFYMINYALMTLGAFSVLIALSSSGVDIERIDDIKGLNAKNPWLAFMMLLVMFSMAGVPPLVGFFAKLGVLEALITVHLVWLAIYALIFAIIGAYYYLNVVKVMYFEEPEMVIPIIVYPHVKWAVTANGILLLLLGLFPGGLIEWCRSAFM